MSRLTSTLIVDNQPCTRQQHSTVETHTSFTLRIVDRTSHRTAPFLRFLTSAPPAAIKHPIVIVLACVFVSLFASCTDSSTNSNSITISRPRLPRRRQRPGWSGMETRGSLAIKTVKFRRQQMEAVVVVMVRILSGCTPIITAVGRPISSSWKHNYGHSCR